MSSHPGNQTPATLFEGPPDLAARGRAAPLCRH